MGLFRHNNNYSDKDIPCDYKMSVKSHNINKNWIICVLAALVVILVAIVCSSSLFKTENVAMIISFTATILSIVLSLLAIIYTYLGNIESSGNLSEIRSAVAEIRATEDAIKDNVSNIINHLSYGTSSQSGVSNQINSDPSPEVKSPNNYQAPNNSGSNINSSEENQVEGQS